MAVSYGTLQLLDTLRVIDKDNVFEYGEDLLYQHVRDLLVAHNEMTANVLGTFAEPSNERIWRWGNQAASALDFLEVEEYGVVDVQKQAVTGVNAGAPLRRYDAAVQWTKDFFETATPRDIVATMTGIMLGDVQNLRRKALTALTRATNYTSTDIWVDNIDIPVKALYNADGTAIPLDRFGNSFNPATHTHLLARVGGALADTDVVAAINTVKEHGVNGGRIQLIINVAQEAAIRAMTSFFDPLQAPMIDPGPGSTADVVRGMGRNDPYEIDDRPIGIWDGYVVVWTKPWWPANYVGVVLQGGANDRVLRLRRRDGGVQPGQLRLITDNEQFPLRAREFRREFGLGVWNRFGAAILYTGGTTYVAPTIV
jgi:hypothetical protein